MESAKITIRFFSLADELPPEKDTGSLLLLMPDGNYCIGYANLWCGDGDKFINWEYADARYTEEIPTLWALLPKDQTEHHPQGDEARYEWLRNKFWAEAKSNSALEKVRDIQPSKKLLDTLIDAIRLNELDKEMSDKKD